MNFILSDEINSGKTTFVLELFSGIARKGPMISGWITPPHIEGGRKVGHDIIFIEGREISSPVPFTRTGPFDGSFPWRRFHFSERAFESAANLKTACDLFIMDEIGPLELEDGRGFLEIMRRAIEDAGSTLIVIRRDLEPKIEDFLGERKKVFHDLSSKTRLETDIYEHFKFN